MSYYRWYIFALAMPAICFCPINFFGIQYTKSIGIETANYGNCLAVTYVFSLAFSYFLGMLSDKFHPVRTSIIALAAYLVLMVVSLFVMLYCPVVELAEPVTVGIGSWSFSFKQIQSFTILFVLHGIVSGSLFTLYASLPARLLPRALFAQFVSATSIVNSLIYIVLAPAVGKLLDLCGYIWIFPLAIIFTLIAVLVFFKVYLNFMAHGGDRNYVAPMPK